MNYSVVLTKDTKVVRGLPIGDDQRKAEKKKNKIELITRCCLKTDKSWIEYTALTKILAYLPTLTGQATDQHGHGLNQKKPECSDKQLNLYYTIRRWGSKFNDQLTAANIGQ